MDTFESPMNPLGVLGEMTGEGGLPRPPGCRCSVPIIVSAQKGTVHEKIMAKQILPKDFGLEGFHTR